MNRRGFIAAILAAPLAVVGSFAGNHLVAGRMAGPDAFAKFKGPVAIWTVAHMYPDADWVLIEMADGKILRHQKWPGKTLPFVSIGDGIYEAKLSPGDLCG